MSVHTDRVAAINSQYRQREENLAAARGLDAPDFDAVETENEVVEPEGDEVEGGEAEAKLPEESWKKDEIVQWLVDNEVIESEDDVKGQTKAELIENFVDLDS